MTAPQPNFLVVGAAKCGTTSLHYWLGQHPQVFVPKQKFLHFFATEWLAQHASGPGDQRRLRDMTATWEQYLEHFREAAPGQAIGDFSPSYFSWWPSRDAIRARLGRPKIILSLRDPVQKAFSQYTHLVRDGRERLSFWEALQAEPERKAKGYGALWLYGESALYAESAERFFEYFGPDSMRIYLFEETIRDPQAALRGIFGFLGVDPEFRIASSEARHKSGAPRSRLLALAVNNQTLRKYARKFLPAQLVSRIGTRATELNTGAKPVLDERSRAFLIEKTRSDRERLARLLGRSLPWQG
jgi:hypothetical protein